MQAEKPFDFLAIGQRVFDVGHGANLPPAATDKELPVRAMPRVGTLLAK